MRINIFTRIALFLCTIIPILSNAQVWDDFELNKAHISSPDLKVNRYKLGFHSNRFNTRIGGVDYGETAQPVNDFNFHKISIHYVSQNDDGERLVVKIDNMRYKTNFADWLLFPTVEFANDTNTACFTLRGEAMFHSAFKETLLGTRVYVADHHGNLTYMPTIEGKAVVAFSEPTFTEELSNKMHEASKTYYNQYNRQIDSSTYWGWDNYIFTDYNEAVQFSVKEDKLHMSGSPYFYFTSRSYTDENYSEVTKLTDWSKNNRDLLREVNPYVYDANTKLMQFAAFFTYIKNLEGKSNWEDFYKSVMQVKTQIDPVILKFGLENE